MPQPSFWDFLTLHRKDFATSVGSAGSADSTSSTSSTTHQASLRAHSQLIFRMIHQQRELHFRRIARALGDLAEARRFLEQQRDASLDLVSWLGCRQWT